MVLCLFREGKMFRHELMKQFLQLVEHAYVVLSSWGHWIWVEITNKLGMKGQKKTGKGEMSGWQGRRWEPVTERQGKEQGSWRGKRLWRGEDHWVGWKMAKRTVPSHSTSSCLLYFWCLAWKYKADFMTGKSSQLTCGSLYLVPKGLCPRF